MSPWDEANEEWHRARLRSGIIAGACITAALAVLVLAVCFALAVGR